MKILLCAATEMEIAPTIQFLASKELESVEVVITGVGLMTSTYALLKATYMHHPDLLIQAGIAGTLNASATLAEVVVVQTETIGDLGVKESAGFQSLFDLKLLSTDLFPWKNARLKNDNETLNNLNLRVVVGVSVNEISTHPETVSYYQNSLGAEVETMEGAALHYVGLMEKILFLQVRSLSNFVGERDKTKWEIKKSIATLNRELQNLLNQYYIA